jgi:PKD repeat protein
MKAITRFVALVVATAVVASCTMKDQDAPPLTGPSEFGTSVTIQVSPDVLQQDGASQSVVTVVVRNAQGQPVSGVPLRAEILVNGIPVDFGALSARNIVTGGDGRVTFVYTAPAVAASVESLVQVAVTPIGTNFANAITRNATIRLVPVGAVLPPSDLVPLFTVSPSSPAQGQTVVFDAQASTGSIAQYRWDFGDGSTGTGETTTHEYDEVSTFVARLTLVDPAGRTAVRSQSVTVGQSAAPVASFTFSPVPVFTNATVHFNASASTPGPGRTIVSYRWDFGDGSAAQDGVQQAHAYSAAATYTVTLTVTDDVGRTAVTTRAVSVSPASVE